MQVFFLTILISASVFPQNTRAEENQAGAHVGGAVELFTDITVNLAQHYEDKFVRKFCEAPAEAVCDHYPLEDLDEKFTKVRKQLHADALRTVETVYEKKGAERVKSMVEGEVGFLLSAASALFPTREETKLFLSQVEKAVERELGESIDHTTLLRKELQPALEKALEHHVTRIEERALLISRVREILSEVEVFTPSRFLEKGGSLPSLQFWCGRQLLSYNSFFFQTDGKKGPPPSIVVCPGVWIQALTAKRYDQFSASYLKDVLTSTLSHELGHRIDYSRYPEYYEEFAQCIYRNLWDEEPFGTTFKEFKEGPFNEMVADYWSAETLAALKELGRVTRGDLIRIIRHSSAPYCRSQPNRLDPHPPGIFRIDLKGRNPRLRDALGCSPESSAKFALCGLEGKVARPGMSPRALPMTK